MLGQVPRPPISLLIRPERVSVLAGEGRGEEGPCREEAALRTFRGRDPPPRRQSRSTQMLERNDAPSNLPACVSSLDSGPRVLVSPLASHLQPPSACCFLSSRRQESQMVSLVSGHLLARAKDDAPRFLRQILAFAQTGAGGGGGHLAPPEGRGSRNHTSRLFTKV